MYCKHCGNEVKQGQKFCGKCGNELSASPSTPEASGKHAWKKPLLIALLVIIAIVAICLVVLAMRGSDTSDAEYENYLTVQEAVDGIEGRYRNAEGYHDPESIPELLDAIENYGLSNDDLISSVERGDDYVEYRLSDGTLYVFMPTLEGVLSGGVDCSIVTFEPWWTDVKGVDSLRLDAQSFGAEDDEFAIEGHSETSAFDLWANEIPLALDEYTFAPNDNINDSNVTIDRFRSIGRNQFILYFGHGGSPTKAHGSFLTTGEETTKEAKKKYKDDLKADKLVQTSSGRLAVTDKFFDASQIGSNAFENTDFFLLACHSCQDARLANALSSCGARTVTGFTESVTVKYGTEMYYGILGLNENANGLLDLGKDGQYLTFAQSIKNAQSVYGASDQYLDFKWYESKHDPAEAVCYPEASAKTARLSDTLVVNLDADKDAAVNFIQEWYDDWTFTDGHEVLNGDPLLARCPPLIAEDSDLFDEFVTSCTSFDGKYSRNFATCVTSTPKAERLEDGRIRVTVNYLGTQNSVDQAMYDRLLEKPNQDVWDVTVGKDGKIVALERPSDSKTRDTSEVWAQFPQSFVFSSGAGAWSTQLDVAADGTFTGYFHDSDMGDKGNDYPNGTRHETHFAGEFTAPIKTNDYEYSMQLKRLEITDSPGSKIVDGVRVVYETDSVYGLGEPTTQPTGEFALHLPGQALSRFSDSAASWLFIQNTASGQSDFYAIVNSSDPSYDLAFRTYDDGGSKTSQNMSEEDTLRGYVQARAKHEILYWFYEDFDNNGTREAMAITGVQNQYYDNEWTDGEIWFANGDGAEWVAGQESGNALNGLVKDDKSGCLFLSIERDGHGSGTTSSVYAVKGDGCWVAMFDVDPIGNFHNDGDRMVGYTQIWDNGFHEYAWHEFEYHPDNATFTSIGEIEVTTSRQY